MINITITDRQRQVIEEHAKRYWEGKPPLKKRGPKKKLYIDPEPKKD